MLRVTTLLLALVTQFLDGGVKIEGKDSCFKIFWVGNENSIGGVDIPLSEEWIEKAFDINRVSDRITIVKLAIDNKITISGDLNGHTGKLENGYKVVHSGYDYGFRKKEGEHVLKFIVAHNLVVGNLYFTKKDNHLITYQSGGISSQIDCIFL